MTTPWPDAEPSPFADWFPETASIRDPVIWGFCPEDGSALTMQLFSEIGGRAVGVIGMTGSGKSNLLNNAREHVTRCTDARLVQLNGAHMGDELTWEPLSALTLCGPVATDETSPRQDRRGAVRAVPAGHQPVSDPRRDRALHVPAHPGRPGRRHHHRRGRRDRQARARRGQGPGVPRLQAAEISGVPAAGHPARRHRGARRRRGPRQHERGAGRHGRAGHRIPARQRRRKRKSPTSASTPAAPPATSSGGTRTREPSPGGAGRSCSASPPRNSPT